MQNFPNLRETIRYYLAGVAGFYSEDLISVTSVFCLPSVNAGTSKCFKEVHENDLYSVVKCRCNFAR